MLILTRMPGQSVMIGDDTVVVVLGVRGNQVHIGFAAPDEVPILREEIYERNLRQAAAREQEAGSGSHKPRHGAATRRWRP